MKKRFLWKLSGKSQKHYAHPSLTYSKMSDLFRFQLVPIVLQRHRAEIIRPVPQHPKTGLMCFSWKAPHPFATRSPTSNNRRGDGISLRLQFREKRTTLSRSYFARMPFLRGISRDSFGCIERCFEPVAFAFVRCEQRFGNRERRIGRSYLLFDCRIHSRYSRILPCS